jgi:predicted ArsR family transcriptional regulator
VLHPSVDARSSYCQRLVAGERFRAGAASGRRPLLHPRASRGSCGCHLGSVRLGAFLEITPDRHPPHSIALFNPMTSLIPLSEPARSVLSQLRHRAMTVEELGRALHLTPNAVRNQLRKLQDANFVVRSGSRPGVSKPSALYSITLEGQVQFSTLYLPVLTEFLEVAEGQCSGKQLRTFMSDTGKSLAKRYPKPTGTLKDRVNAAARLLKGFGGIIEVQGQNGSTVLRSSGCPLAALTSENAAACRVIEGLLAEYLSTSVTTCCDLAAEPRCCFEVAGPTKTQPLLR